MGTTQDAVREILKSHRQGMLLHNHSRSYSSARSPKQTVCMTPTSFEGKTLTRSINSRKACKDTTPNWLILVLSTLLRFHAYSCYKAPSVSIPKRTLRDDLDGKDRFVLSIAEDKV